MYDDVGENALKFPWIDGFKGPELCCLKTVDVVASGRFPSRRRRTEKGTKRNCVRLIFTVLMW